MCLTLNPSEIYFLSYFVFRTRDKETEGEKKNKKISFNQQNRKEVEEEENPNPSTSLMRRRRTNKNWMNLQAKKNTCEGERKFFVFSCKYCTSEEKHQTAISCHLTLPCFIQKSIYTSELKHPDRLLVVLVSSWIRTTSFFIIINIIIVEHTIGWLENQNANEDENKGNGRMLLDW